MALQPVKDFQISVGIGHLDVGKDSYKTRLLTFKF